MTREWTQVTAPPPEPEKCGLCAPHTARDHSAVLGECMVPECRCRRFIPERDFHRRTDAEKAAERAAEARPTAEEARAAHELEMAKLGPVERARRAHERQKREREIEAATKEAQRHWPEHRQNILASVSASDAQAILAALTEACAGDPSILGKVCTVLEDFGLHHGGAWPHAISPRFTNGG